MPKLIDTAISFLILLLAALLFVTLTWIPVFGPLAVGLFIGFNLGHGMFIGMKYSAITSLFSTLVISGVFIKYMAELTHSNPFLSAFILWVCLVYNLFGVFVCTFGGGIGAVAQDIRGIFTANFLKMDSQKRVGGKEYILCTSCGGGNPFGETHCVSCGQRL